MERWREEQRRGSNSRRIIRCEPCFASAGDADVPRSVCPSHPAAQLAPWVDLLADPTQCGITPLRTQRPFFPKMGKGEIVLRGRFSIEVLGKVPSRPHNTFAHLARSVVGHLTASLRAVQWVGRLLQVKLDMLLAAACAQGVHGRVLRGAHTVGTHFSCGGSSAPPHTKELPPTCSRKTVSRVSPPVSAAAAHSSATRCFCHDHACVAEEGGQQQ